MAAARRPPRRRPTPKGGLSRGVQGGVGWVGAGEVCGGVRGCGGGWAKSEESRRLLPSTLHYALSGGVFFQAHHVGRRVGVKYFQIEGVQAHHVGRRVGVFARLGKNKFGFSSKSCRGQGSRRFSSGRLPWPRGGGRRAKRPACRPPPPLASLRQVAMASEEAGLRKPVNGLPRDVGNTPSVRPLGIRLSFHRPG